MSEPLSEAAWYVYGASGKVREISAYETGPGRWVLAENDAWLPGIYDSAETARRAADLPDDTLHELRSVYHKDGENRAVTMDDLVAADPAREDS